MFEHLENVCSWKLYGQGHISERCACVSVCFYEILSNACVCVHWISDVSAKLHSQFIDKIQGLLLQLWLLRATSFFSSLLSFNLMWFMWIMRISFKSKSICLKKSNEENRKFHIPTLIQRVFVVHLREKLVKNSFSFLHVTENSTCVLIVDPVLRIERLSVVKRTYGYVLFVCVCECAPAEHGIPGNHFSRFLFIFICQE